MIQLTSDSVHLKYRLLKTAIIFLALVLIPSIATAQDFFAENDAWTTFPYPALGCRIHSISILPELNRLNTSLRMGYTFNTPYDIIGDSGALKVNQTLHNVSFLMPIITNNHHFTLRFNSVENNSSLTASSKSNQTDNATFNLSTDYSSEAFLFAHYWKRFNISWGGELKLIDRGSETKTESALEVGWGDLSNSRLRFLYSREFTDTPWLWRLDNEQIHGELNNITVTKLAELSFGDPFSVQLSMIAGAEEIIHDDPTMEDIETINLNSEFSRSYVSIKLKKNPPHKISWWVGGIHIGGNGDLAAITSENDTTAYSYASTLSFDEWGGMISIPITRSYQLSFTPEYFSWKIYTDGFLFPETLPFAFANCFADTSVFFLDFDVQGMLLRTEIERHAGALNMGLKLGLSQIWVNGTIEDFSLIDNEEHTSRTMSLPLSRATIGFLTIRTNYNYKKITIGGSVNQLLVLDQETDGRDIFGNGSQKGGLNGKFWVAINF